jgi:glyoxylate reductase
MNKYKIVMTKPAMDAAMKMISEQCDIRLWQEAKSLDKETLKNWVSDCEGIYCVGDKIDEEILSSAPKLKVISQPAVGYDNIDIAACTAHGVFVGNTPGAVTDATADLTMAHILTASRRFVEGWDSVRTGKWTNVLFNSKLGSDLKNKTLGIVGFGQIGRAVAKRALAFGMKIVYYNRHRRDEFKGAQYMELDELLGCADFVSLHIALTPETAKMINRSNLKKMKSTAMLINMARGAVIDTDALYEALRDKTIAFASLDVTDPEPISNDHPLLSLDNVVITPHLGTAAIETRTEMAMIAAENLHNGLADKPLKFCVNPEAREK